MKPAHLVDRVVDAVPFLQKIGMEASMTLHNAILSGGDGARELADLLHGTWLGHPLHPVLTDVPIGSWSAAVLFDLLALTGEGEKAEYAADRLTALGTLAALPTVVTGLADYSAVAKSAVPTATLHALLMDLTFSLYLASLWQRKQGNRGKGVLYSTLGFALLTVGAYVGGHLSYKQKVGVDHTEAGKAPETWQAVLPEKELSEGSATRISVDENPILLYRHEGTVYAIGAVCSHAGGPLEEGEFDGFCVTCPWHHSVFDVRDGSIVHGPTTYPQPNYRVRVRGGQIEVRVAEADDSSHDHSH